MSETTDYIQQRSTKDPEFAAAIRQEQLNLDTLPSPSPDFVTKKR